MTRNAAHNIRVRVLLFGAARDAVGQAEIELLLAREGTSAAGSRTANQNVSEAQPIRPFITHRSESGIRARRTFH